ncbi:MAG: 4Fe-4S binding protein [bacterium]
MKRDIIKIDETRCTGCGQCIPNCPEGALQIIDGKARLVSDLSCDGLGACVGHCPEDAISIESREAEPYDERKVMESVVEAGPNVISAHLDHLASHGQDAYRAQAVAYLREKGIPEPAPAPQAPAASELWQWPVQLHLLNPHAPYFRGADLLVVADCVPFAYPGLHDRFLKGKVLVVFCPKLDHSDEIYVEKLAEIIKHNDVKSITALHMEVPCCFGTTRLVGEALKRSGKNIALEDHTVSIRGELV